MRIAIVEVMGSLIRYLGSDSEEWQKDRESTQKQIVGLYDLLLERTLDVSTYVRAKVYQVFTRLLRGGHKFPKQRLAMMRSAISALEDKAASVRKASIVAIVELICTHPYTDDGGMLVMHDWQERFNKVRDELAQLEGKVGKVVERQSDEESGVENEEEDDPQPQKSKPKGNGKGKGKRRALVPIFANGNR
jgi:condensin complex subunit 1